MKKAKKKNEWVVYPEPQFTLDELMKVNMSEEEKIDVSSIKPVENILDLPKETEVVTEVPNLVDQNQGEEAPKELTEEEKRLKFIEAIKQSHIRYKPKNHVVKTIGYDTVTSSIGITRQVKRKELQTNQTVSRFGAAYKAERKRKNKAQRKSRKLNRK